MTSCICFLTHPQILKTIVTSEISIQGSEQVLNTDFKHQLNKNTQSRKPSLKETPQTKHGQIQLLNFPGMGKRK